MIDPFLLNTVTLSDCFPFIAGLPDNSVDSLLTDPPSGTGFMGKQWDNHSKYEPVMDRAKEVLPLLQLLGLQKWEAGFVAFTCDWATAVMRVMKPGASGLVWALPRTSDLTTLGLRLAGFEIRDSVYHLFGSGYPKIHDIAKRIDRKGGKVADFTGFRDEVKRLMKEKGLKRKDLDTALGNYMAHHYLTYGEQPAIPNKRDYEIIRDFCGLSREWDRFFNEAAEREILGVERTGDNSMFLPNGEYNITTPATDEAKLWDGWQTALKPAVEPWILIMKPVEGTIAENALTWGVAGLNIGGSKVNGRHPAHLILDEFTAGLLDEQETGASRFFYVAKPSPAEKHAKISSKPTKRDASRNVDQPSMNGGEGNPYNRGAKPVKNTHPTVKPIELMRYLLRLLRTPTGGVTLDCFASTGTTVIAGIMEGQTVIGCERDPVHHAEALERINGTQKPLLIVTAEKEKNHKQNKENCYEPNTRTIKRLGRKNHGVVTPSQNNWQ